MKFFLFFLREREGEKRTLCPNWPNLKPFTGSTDLDLYAPPQKVAGYYVIPSELLSVCPSVCPSVRPSVRQRLIIRVRSITLIPFEIISRNLAQI